MVNSNMAIAETELTDFKESDTYTLTLDPNGGYVRDLAYPDPDNHMTTKPYVVSVTFGDEVGELPVPHRMGYEFQGWFKTKSGLWNSQSNYPYMDQIKLEVNTTWEWKQDLTFEARWDPKKCTLTWDANGGKIDNATYKEWHDIDYGSVIGALPQPMPTPDKKGYEFTGWFTHPKSGGQILEYSNVESKVESKTETPVITYYAHWKVKIVTVSFDTLVDGLKYPDITLNYGDKLTELPTPTRLGYKWEGWYTQATDGEKVANGWVVT